MNPVAHLSRTAALVKITIIPVKSGTLTNARLPQRWVGYDQLSGFSEIQAWSDILMNRIRIDSYLFHNGVPSRIGRRIIRWRDAKGKP
jgi:hypothetical protein